MKDKNSLKREFKELLREFVQSLNGYVSHEGQWTIKGFIDLYKNLYTISADTKIISKILEIHLFPKILDFASEKGYYVVLADCQNWYPDLSFINKEDNNIKFAVDLKTTYRDEKFPGHVNGFTLGSHGEYFINRTSSKNIQIPYAEYLGHFCLGIIYSRVGHCDLPDIYKVEEIGLGVPSTTAKLIPSLKSVVSVINDFMFFVHEKWEIASDHQGSSNTANIGSITWIEDLIEGNGVFKNLGEEVFDNYWMNYGRLLIKTADGKEKKITNLKEFLVFKNIDQSLIYTKKTKKKHKDREA